MHCAIYCTEHICTVDSVLVALGAGVLVVVPGEAVAGAVLALAEAVALARVVVGVLSCARRI